MNTRRGFLRSATVGGAWAACGRLGLSPVAADEVQVRPDMVRLSPESEPLVRLLEDTPRERLIEAAAERVRRGTTYREILAALLLAGVRNVQPRPSVGFKFHAVLVVQSLHLTSQASADTERWLPLFWGLDYFKQAQAQDAREGDWTMRSIDETKLPAPAEAQAAFRRAMDRWDEPAADAAVAALARVAKPNELFDVLFAYGARDFRSIGHKAIFAANVHRTLGVIGPRDAEPILRSLAYAMLQHEGDNPADRDADADRPGRQNAEAAKRLRADWLTGRADPAATTRLLDTLRTGGAKEASALVVELVNSGVAVASVWDALFVGAAELVLRQPGIVALHAVTTTNALHYAFAHSGDDPTRRFALLQNAAFLPLFREAMSGRGKLADRRLDRLSAPAPRGRRADADAILAEVSGNPLAAAGMMLGCLDAGGDAQKLMAAARRVLLVKGDDPHDYKFGEAVFEDFAAVSPAWRARCLAASALRLHGAADRDNPLVARIRAAFG